LNEKGSVFSINDFVSQRDTTFNLPKSKFKEVLLRLIPNISENIKARKNYDRLVSLLLSQSASPRVLIIGGSILGQGMEPLVQNRSLELVESDVSFGPRTMLICDAHDIPFEDETFDGVIVQAVLEHVVDPYRCVEEIHRVLKKEGLVYADTPFMQQVHMGRHDFTRFTHLGHRRLFRKFDEIDSGAACGPGMALAWSYQYFCFSFTTSRPLRVLIRTFATLTSFYLKDLDYYLIEKAGTLDAASAYYFLGRKGNHILSDRELLKLYRGAF
jgi:SAM-dependent methyltransferase